MESLKLSMSNFLPSHLERKHESIFKLLKEREKKQIKTIPEFIEQEKLGHGGFGEVYKIKTDDNNEYAMKKIIPKSSLASTLIEASMMKSITHPYITDAKQIFIRNDEMYIIQDLAICDLSRYTNKTKQGNIVPINRLKYFANQLFMAVRYLHENHIIHADIKAANILMYGDDTIKLADFSVSVCTYLQSIGLKTNYEHKVSTPTHTPLELWLRKPWNHSLDIWCIGCTLYEIAYGESLFPNHNSKKIKTLANKIQLREKSINSLLQWAEKGPIQQRNIYEDEIKYQRSMKHLSWRLSPNFYDSVNSDYNRVILQCLKINPAERLHIKDMFFNNVDKPVVYIEKELPYITLLKIFRTCNNNSMNKDLLERYDMIFRDQQQLLEIVCLANSFLDKIDADHVSPVTLDACLFIAHKLLTRENMQKLEDRLKEELIRIGDMIDYKYL
jgi:serine/threonine protein kinase